MACISTCAHARCCTRGDDKHGHAGSPRACTWLTRRNPATLNTRFVRQIKFASPDLCTDAVFAFNNVDANTRQHVAHLFGFDYSPPQSHDGDLWTTLGPSPGDNPGSQARRSRSASASASASAGVGRTSGWFPTFGCALGSYLIVDACAGPVVLPPSTAAGTTGAGTLQGSTAAGTTSSGGTGGAGDGTEAATLSPTTPVPDGANETRSTGGARSAGDDVSEDMEAAILPFVPGGTAGVGGAVNEAAPLPPPPTLPPRVAAGLTDSGHTVNKTQTRAQDQDDDREAASSRGFECLEPTGNASAPESSVASLQGSQSMIIVTIRNRGDFARYRDE